MEQPYPRTAEEFLALPVYAAAPFERHMENGQVVFKAARGLKVFYIPDDGVLRCVDQQGIGWQLAQRWDDEWCRVQVP